MHEWTKGNIEVLLERCRQDTQDERENLTEMGVKMHDYTKEELIELIILTEMRVEDEEEALNHYRGLLEDIVGEENASNKK